MASGKKSTKSSSRSSKTKPSGRLSRKQIAHYRHLLSGGSSDDESSAE